MAPRRVWLGCLLASTVACGGHRVLPESETSSGEGASSAGEAGGSTGTPGNPTSGGGTGGNGSEGDEDDGAADDGSTFVPDMPDDGFVDCDINAAYNECPEGQKCMPYNHPGWGWTHGACFPMVDDPVPLHGSCEWFDSPWSGKDNCGEYAYCRNANAEGQNGTCTGICRAPWGGGGGADIPVCEDSMTLPYVGCQSCFCECLANCDPLAQECGEGQACIQNYNDGFMCVLDASGDEGQVGDPCNYANSCDPGNLCVNTESMPPELCLQNASGCCSAFCDLGADNCESLAPGTVCQPSFDPAPPGFEHVGICLVAP